MRDLRKANKVLSEENRRVNETLRSTIGTLQNQMNAAMVTAVEKKKELERRLAESEEIIRLLRQRLQERDDLNLSC
jgi:ABC-type Fe3+-citrate transport system substrate-binding protein